MELGQEAIDLLDGMENVADIANIRPSRMFVVIARDERHVWRCREVRARSHEQAVRAYSKILPNYEIMAVGMLGGSGFPLVWLRDVSESPVTPDWVPDWWRVSVPAVP